jgi:predicted nucleic acid-binding protein
MAKQISRQIAGHCNACTSEGSLQRLSTHRFSRIGHLNALRKLYPEVHISLEIYDEVVVAGAGMPGATAVNNADWIHVAPVRDAKALAEAILRTGLGPGEVSAVLLAKELAADLILMDEHKGRKLAI